MSLKLSRGPEINLEKCVANVGNRYDLVLIAAQRARERSRRMGDKQKLSAVINSLKDIEAGRVGRDYLKKI